MSGRLTTDAENVLRALIAGLPNAVPGRPETYLQYKQVHDLLGLHQQGPTYGESLKRQGLEVLARWSAENGYPAITGLVVDGSTLQPAEGFYRLYGRHRDDFNWWREEIARAKDFDWLAQVSRATSPIPASVSSIDANFKGLLADFTKPGLRFVAQWLPDYKNTVERIKASLAQGELKTAFEFIWRTQHNGVAHAGQGVLGFESIDRVAGELTQVMVEISRDPSPANFARQLEAMQRLRDEKRISKVPHLLLARAFASIAPEKYHTTVDAGKQDIVIDWIEQHSSFRSPATPNWAEKAAALTEFLSRLGELHDTPLLRNMFPWFVYEQVQRDSDGRPVLTPRSPERTEGTFGAVPEGLRQIELRHNALSKRLFSKLESEVGSGRVFVDQPSGSGGWVDAIVKHESGEIWLYEIKVVPTASLAVREAMGQLLEYAFRQGGWNPAKLLVVAEPELDDETATYIDLLQDRFRLPMEYLRITL